MLGEVISTARTSDMSGKGLVNRLKRPDPPLIGSCPVHLAVTYNPKTF